MKKIMIIMLASAVSILMLMTFSLTGCKGTSVEEVEEAVEEVEEAVEEVEEAVEEVEEVVEEDMDEIDPWLLEKRASLEKYRREISPDSRGPNGEIPTSYTELVLTVAEVEKIRAGKEDGTPYTLVTNMDGSHGVPTTAAENAIKETCDHLGIEILAFSEAEYDPTKQKSDIETLLALNPDIIVSAPVDRISAAEAFRPAVEAGVKIVFWSNVPEGYVQGVDYVGVSTAHPHEQGVLSGEQLAEAVGESGQVGFVIFGAEFWICNYIDNIAKEIIENNYPDIEIVAYEGWQNVPDAEPVAAAMIQTYPDIEGMHCSWTEPGEMAALACQAAGRDDIKITTLGLGDASLINMLTGGNITALAADFPYQYAINHVLIGAYGILGKECPAYVVTPNATVNKDNVEEVWNASLNLPLSDEIAALLQ